MHEYRMYCSEEIILSSSLYLNEKKMRKKIMMQEEIMSNRALDVPPSLFLLIQKMLPSTVGLVGEIKLPNCLCRLSASPTITPAATRFFFPKNASPY